MKTMRMVRPSEYRKIMKQKEDDERKRKEEAEAAALAAQKKQPAKGGAKPAAKKDEPPQEPEIVIDMSEEPTVEMIETIAEVEFDKIDSTDKNVPLKTSLVCDYAKYEIKEKDRAIDFLPTLMYASRSAKFTIKNTSLININYNFRIVNSETGILDAGPYSIIPKKGTIAPGCNDNFVIKFSPVEVENNFSRILSANIENLSPE
jgi:hydrocephalus-inducing protein